ncbi:MAG: DedA family protein [Bacteroidota bacterium]
MQFILENLFLHGYWVVALGLIIDAIGLPFPGDVLLLTTGFLVFKGSLQLEFVLPLAILAALVGDTLSFSLGRYLQKSRGKNLVSIYCTWASCTFSSKACHEKAQRNLGRYQGRTIVFGKFLWGAREFIPPLAGMSAISYPRFITLDLAGIALWVSTFVPLGILLGDQFKYFIAYFKNVTSLIAFVVIGAFAVLLVLKYIKRKRFGGYREEKISLLNRNPMDGHANIDQIEKIPNRT